MKDKGFETGGRPQRRHRNVSRPEFAESESGCAATSSAAEWAVPMLPPTAPSEPTATPGPLGELPPETATSPVPQPTTETASEVPTEPAPQVAPDPSATPPLSPVPESSGSDVAGASGLVVWGGVRAVLEAAAVALGQLPGVVGSIPEPELAAAMELLGEVSLGVDAAEVAVVAEAVERGVPSSARRAATPAGWVANSSRRYRCGAGTTRLVTVAAATRASETRDILGAAVLAGRVPVGCAAAALAQMRRLVPDLNPAAVPVVWQAFTDLAAATGDITQVNRLPHALRATYGRDGLLAKDEEEARRHRCLSRGSRAGDGLFDYLLRVSTEDAATLEAALSPFTAPQPTEEGGPDPRGSDQRRADALLTLIHRAVTAGGGVPARPKAELLLQISLDDLTGEHGAAVTVGGVDPGRFLSAQTVKRISCDSALRPIILDRHGNLVLIGHARRLFTPTQVKALLIRDGHCTFPGCTSPGAWADAHHLLHWADGGPTDLQNATLLCGFHHHIVHTRRLAGHLTTDPDAGTVHVQWDLTRGSYDQHLTTLTTPTSGAGGDPAGQGSGPGSTGPGGDPTDDPPNDDTGDNNPDDDAPGDEQRRERP